MTSTPSALLPRERTGLPDNVRSVPAPQLPTFESPWTLRLVELDSGDPELIAEWMSQPHLVETWEQPWPADRWRADSAARLAGNYSRPCILEHDGAPVAYVELYRFLQDECGALTDADPWDLGLHIATGDIRLIGRGIVSAWIAALGPALRAVEPRCRRLFADPDHRNIPMHRALTKAGFQDLGTFDARPDRRINLFVWTHDLPGATR